jgi:hypothetical protein
MLGFTPQVEGGLEQNGDVLILPTIDACGTLNGARLSHGTPRRISALQA